MPVQHLIFSLESVPGEPPRPLEQPNGDLLLPASLRQEVAAALALIEMAMDPRAVRGAGAFTGLKRLLAVDGAPAWKAPDGAANLLKAFPLK